MFQRRSQRQQGNRESQAVVEQTLRDVEAARVAALEEGEAEGAASGGASKHRLSRAGTRWLEILLSKRWKPADGHVSDELKQTVVGAGH